MSGRRPSLPTALGRTLLVAAATLSFATVPGKSETPFSHFPAKAAEPTLEASYLLALASDLAYPARVADSSDSTLSDRFRDAYAELGLALVADFENEDGPQDTQALLLRGRNDLLLIVFRGSEASGGEVFVRDWLLTDARIGLVPLGETRVHRGFQEGLAGVYEQLLKRLEGERSGARLWLTGHSLGGALANLAAYRLHAEGVQIQGLVTFASPRVGDASWQHDFESRFGERSHQWIHDHDPVPRLPPASEKRPYVNVGQINLIGPDHPTRFGGSLTDLGRPHPAVHPMKVYKSLIYSDLSGSPLLGSLDPPSPICPMGYKAVGSHPENGLPLCRRRLSGSISERDCLQKGGGVAGEWCAYPVDLRARYRVQPLKGR